MKRSIWIITCLAVCISGWVIAGLTAYHFITAGEAGDEAQQAERDMAQISSCFWAYAQKHDGHLPASIKGGLPGYLYSEEFLAYGYDFLAPNESIFTLPASTPLLRRELSRTPGYEIIRQVGGNTYTQRVVGYP